MAKAKQFMVETKLVTPLDRKLKGRRSANDSELEGEARVPLF